MHLYFINIIINLFWLSVTHSIYANVMQNTQGYCGDPSQTPLNPSIHIDKKVRFSTRPYKLVSPEYSGIVSEYEGGSGGKAAILKQDKTEQNKTPQNVMG